MIPKWSDSSREERFFTAILFQAVIQDWKPLWHLLGPRLALATEVGIVDVGFEVCMLRDLAHAGHINRVPELEKQTFDLVLTLSNESLVLIEAKAHQRFNTKQIEEMERARTLLLANQTLALKEVFLVGLHSSRYRPAIAGPRFRALLEWAEIGAAYPAFVSQLQRADQIFQH